MKKLCLPTITMIISLLLTACADKYQDYYQTQVHHNLLKECWMGLVNTNTHTWAWHADRWFTTGNPNQIEQYSHVAPVSESISTMSVRSADFTNIQYRGSYQVQIMGYQDHNSVYIIGPNDQVRKVIVKTSGRTLYLRQSSDCNSTLNKVIVRVGVHDLHNLMVSGSGTILGRNVYSEGLSIYSTGKNRIFLDGNMNLTRVAQYGSGTMTIMGANTPSLKLKVIGPGCVNISGAVGIEQLTHAGSGVVSIVGANTDRLCINTSGCGLTTVYGFANLKRVNAIDSSQVYVYWVNSCSTYVFARNRARVGLAGTTKNLNVDTIEGARFDGSYLNGENVYARTRDNSHANIRASQKLFAAALDNSSIYFMGSPTVVSRYTSKNGIVLPIWCNNDNQPTMTLTHPSQRMMTYQHTKTATHRPAYK